MNPLTLPEINRLTREAFTEIVGPVFEGSPWIAEQTWLKRPFASREALHQRLCETVAGASESDKLELIRAHPDLVGRAALAGTLTPASTKEQAAAGLDRLSEREIERFREYNREYREKFGFPFIVCARLNQKDAILAGFERRLNHGRDAEIGAALQEIFKIAELRLCDLIVT